MLPFYEGLRHCSAVQYATQAGANRHGWPAAAPATRCETHTLEQTLFHADPLYAVMSYPLVQRLCSSQNLAFALPVDLQVLVHLHDVVWVYNMRPWQVEGTRRDVRQRPRLCRGRLLSGRSRRWCVGGCWSCFRLSCYSTAGPGGCWSSFRLNCCSTAGPIVRACCSLLCRC
jgi:hypothetical protein